MKGDNVNLDHDNVQTEYGCNRKTMLASQSLLGSLLAPPILLLSNRNNYSQDRNVKIRNSRLQNREYETWYIYKGQKHTETFKLS